MIVISRRNRVGHHSFIAIIHNGIGNHTVADHCAKLVNIFIFSVAQTVTVAFLVEHKHHRCRHGNRGCNRLIGNGAGIAVSVAQLLQELQGSVPHAGRDEAFSLAQAERPNAAKAAGVIADKMLCPVTDALSSTASSSWPPLRKTIWQALDTMPQSMDEIADTLVRQKISINVQMLMQELVFLELEGAAGSVMGRYYRKTFACNDG